MSARVLVLGAALSVSAIADTTAAPPEGWFLAGMDPKSYAITVDPTVAHTGKGSARFASTKKPTAFGTMMQSMEPGEYRGKRVRYSGWVKAKDVEPQAGLWMRVDGPGNKMLAFDNMNNRPIQGTSDWTKYDIVLDVGEEAIGISFGILMSGAGTTWLDDVKFEIVDASVPVTGGRAVRQKPANLNFEQ